jgi:hypothetical protein
MQNQSLAADKDQEERRTCPVVAPAVVSGGAQDTEPCAPCPLCACGYPCCQVVAS